MAATTTREVEESKSSWMIRVSGWGSPRLCALHEGFIYFQAATCYPCGTCNSRVDQLQQGLERSGRADGIEKRSLDKLLFFVLPIPQGLSEVSSPAEVTDYLSTAFDVDLSPLVDYQGKPIPLPIKKTLYHQKVLKLEWDKSDSSKHLAVSSDGRTLESQSPMQAAWLGALTTARLREGSYSLDFHIENIANRQIGIGFMLTPIDWGFFGYLGSSTSAWSYDAYEGAIVTGTDAIHSGLPTIQSSGVVTLILKLEGKQHSAQFTVDGVPTPEIDLPQDCTVIPAGCLLKQGQKVTLENFKVL